MKHQSILDRAIQANHERSFFAQYPEHPKAYGDEGMQTGLANVQGLYNNFYKGLLQENMDNSVGEEVSPYTQEPLNVRYPTANTAVFIKQAQQAFSSWKKLSKEQRADILIECLEQIKTKFYEIAYATMHTTGQSFMMSFQASGPHSNDRALEAIAAGYEALNAYSNEVLWEKPMGKFNLKLKKEFHAVPRGIGLVIGCSTFPVWNTLPGAFADLMTGNTVIIKPHPKAVLPIAIVVEEMQKVMKANGVDIHTIQLACDDSSKLITKELCEHPAIKLIDYTGGSTFGNYVESLQGKTVFTEKAGVNSVILDSVNKIDEVLGNLAFSVSLYSGQMCTAPQNFFIPAKVNTAEGELSFKEIAEKFKASVAGIANNPKMGPGTLGAIQNELTAARVKNIASLGKTVLLESTVIANEEFPSARTCSPTILVCDASDTNVFEQELFGPIVLLIKTTDTKQAVSLAKDMCEKHGAITCAVYSTDTTKAEWIKEVMESVFAPVSLNLTGFIWVNQHAAFSDFHVTGGNPAGNATFTNSSFVDRRFVWVGHREVIA